MGVASCSGNRKILWVSHHPQNRKKTGRTNPAFVRSMFCFFALSGHMAMFLPWAIIHRLINGINGKILRSHQLWRSRWLVLWVERSCCMLGCSVQKSTGLTGPITSLSGEFGHWSKVFGATCLHMSGLTTFNTYFSMFTQPPSRKCHGCSPKLMREVSLSNP